uniref:suppressor of cytokine signaling 1b n=1 Tax=Centroberyx gerrardi TaxID=166262 RepID=UPI003AAF8553
MVQWRMLRCRMVRDNLDSTVQNREQNGRAETQNRSQAPAEGPQSPDRVEPENQEPKEGQQDLVQWNKLLAQRNSEKEADVPTEQLQAVARPCVESWPTHLRPFSSKAEYHLVRDTHLQLQHSGFYWGPMTMETAHEILTDSPQGTFLVRDSGQPDVFFTLSYQGDDGPTSVRVLLNKKLLFSLHGSHKTFVSLFVLLSFYTGSSCKLTLPYRRQRPELLMQMCRRAVMRQYGADSIQTLPGLNAEVKDYLHAYPYGT